MVPRTGLIRIIEEHSLTALPALQTAFYDGWVLRFAAGHTRRANSVNPLYGSTLPTRAKIAYCAGVYRARGLRPVFKLTEAAQPTDLDATLADMGFAEEAHTSVQLRDLDNLDNSDLEPVTLLSAPDAAWSQACADLNGMDAGRGNAFRGILTNLVVPAAYAQVVHNDALVAVGMAVITPGYVGLFDIVTAPEYRQQGLAQRIVRHLMLWGQQQGAQRAYLQVVPQNTPALRLYARLGFREVYQYWYRTQD
jgi:N-acetylglutamate synthase